VSLGPFRLEPVFLSKVWAAPEIAGPLGPVLAAPQRTGEVWLASDRHSITGVADSPWTPEAMGLGLDEVCARWNAELLGPEHRDHGDGDGFPLLIKILSVGDWLSVQVHPDDEAARRLENEPWGKNEAWLILGAEDKAEIVMGLKPGMDREKVQEAVAQGRMPEVLAKVPARAGEVFHLPAGMVHATGPGLTIFEIQQASDVTYRFFDWDRPGDDGKPRELHVDKALRVMQTSGPGQPSSPRELSGPPNRTALLVDDPHFALLQAELAEPYQPFLAQPALRLLFVLQGEGNLYWENQETEIKPGQTWCLPHGLDGIEVRPASPLTMLESVALSA
jgi:mannose-6-phosphate isomerase